MVRTPLRETEDDQKSENTYRELFENMLDGVARLTLEGRFIECNAAFLIMIGFSAEEISERALRDILPKKCENIAQLLQEQLLRVGFVDRLEEEFIKKDGTPFPVELRAHLSRDGDGEVSGMWVIATDITERTRAQEELKKTEEGCKAIFEASWDCIFMKDRSLRYTAVNPALANLFELPASAIIGKRDEDMLDPGVAEKLKEVDSRVLDGQTIEEEHDIEIKGIPMSFLVVKTPMKDSEGRIFGISGIAHDITERKRLRHVSLDYNFEYPSPAMRATLTLARLAAKSDSIILLTGESGSGKDYLAGYIHKHSRRSTGPFYSVNCAAIPRELAESELFGYESGAFTGAGRRKRGLLELAEGGTLLLNEIGELSPTLQAKLLTFLDTRAITRVGGEKRIDVNARIIMATNKDLPKEVEEGRFRKDLYYRIAVLTIQVPPLRQRIEDIPILVRQLSTRLAAELQISQTTDIDPATMEKLCRHTWPGNVRELRNELERALILFSGGQPNVELLGMERAEKRHGLPLLPGVEPPTGDSLNEKVRNLKKSLIEHALEQSQGKKVEAARLLGISRDSLKQQMKGLGISGIK
jgi:PAS domain S-box-containing protein